MEKLKLTPNVLKIDDSDRTITALITVDGQDLIPDDGAEYTLKIANASGHVKDITLAELAFSSAELKSLPADTYTAEVWMTNGDFKYIWMAHHPHPQTLTELKDLVKQGVEYFNTVEISSKRNNLTAEGFRNEAV